MEVNGCISEKEQNSGGGEKIFSLPHTLDLPPTSSPKLKAMTRQRVHELGCPPIVHFLEQI